MPSLPRRVAAAPFSASLCAVALALPAASQLPPATFQHTVTDGAASYVADFAQHTARGPNFEVLVQQPDGSIAAHAAGAIRTYTGSIAALPGAMASAVLRADGTVNYHVLFEDGAEWIHNAGTTTLRTDATSTPNFPTFVTGPGGAGSTVHAAEVGVDLPHSQFALHGNAAAALEMIEHSVHTVNLLYLRDASIQHRLGRVVLRADAAQDPYAGMTTTGALLTEVRNQWNNVLPAGTHDVALVATSATGGGLANVGVVGSPGYSANGASVEGDFTVVWRHEVGHNWSLGHFDGGTPEGRTINSGNALSRMSGSEEAKVLAHRTARLTHLDVLGPHPVAIPPRASLDRATWLPDATGVVLDVLGNDHDANGDAFDITDFEAVTQRGGTVTRSVGTGPGGRDELVYAPSRTPLSSAPDWFTYRITDTTGRTGTGTVVTRLTSDSGLLAHFAMDGASTDTAIDSSSYLRHAALDGGPTRTPGVVGGGIRFDGVDDRLLADALDRPTDRLTITAWVRRDGTQNANAGLVFCRGGSTTSGLNFGQQNELRYHWNGGQWAWNSGLVVPDDTWTFVALVVTPTAATLYMDDGTGLHVATNAANHAVEAFDAGLTIGRDPHSAPRSFRGTLDDVRIHARALSSGEVASAAQGLGSASAPNPPHLGTRNQSLLQLSWQASPAATSHRVYLSRDYASVRDGLATADQGTVQAPFFATPPLGNGTWFWRVDATDGSQSAEGPIWAVSIVPGGTFALAANYGTGCPGSQNPPVTPRASAGGGLPRIGSTTFSIDLLDAAPSASAALLLATQSADIPVDSGCLLLVEPPGIATLSLTTDPAGTASLPLNVPFDVSLLGLRLFGQFVVVDGGGALFGAASMSDGLHLTVGV